jgi:pimeloyl-ACP methyl ester carboxylesterase
MEASQQEAPNTVVLIHGLWMSALSWENWVDRYTKRGYRVIARSWPGMEGDIDELRRDPSGIEHLGIAEIVDYYESIIGELDEPPIIMGHSFGGAFTEILLDRGLGAAGVAIDAAAVKGVLKLPLSTLRSGFPVLRNPANNHRAVMLNADEFHYAFTNTMSEEDSVAAYERYAVPGPGRVLWQAAFANFNPRAATRVDFRRDRAPLLLIAGGDDHIVPAAVDRSMAKHYAKSTAVTEYKEFSGRSHFTVGEAGWEEVADYALDWAAQAARQRTMASAGDADALIRTESSV